MGGGAGRTSPNVPATSREFVAPASTFRERLVSRKWKVVEHSGEKLSTEKLKIGSTGC
jgi:hypothetical protein